jgi:hypothetical protein
VAKRGKILPPNTDKSDILQHFETCIARGSAIQVRPNRRALKKPRSQRQSNPSHRPSCERRAHFLRPESNFGDFREVQQLGERRIKVRINGNAIHVSENVLFREAAGSSTQDEPALFVNFVVGRHATPRSVATLSGDWLRSHGPNWARFYSLPGRIERAKVGADRPRFRSSGASEGGTPQIQAYGHETAHMHPVFETIVTCEDMSKGGFRFMSGKEFPEGTRVEGAVPYTKFGNHILLPACIVYCRELPDGQFRHGVAYVKASGSIGWDSPDIVR